MNDQSMNMQNPATKLLEMPQHDFFIDFDLLRISCSKICYSLTCVLLFYKLQDSMFENNSWIDRQFLQFFIKCIQTLFLIFHTFFCFNVF